MKSTIKLMFVLCALLLPFTGIQAQNLEAEMQSFIDNYEKAQAASNAVGLANMYTKDAVYTNYDGTGSVGRKAIAATFKGAFEMVDIKAEIKPDDILEMGNGLLAITGTFSSTQKVKANGQKIPVNGHYQVIMKKDNGDWKIIRHLNMLPMAPPN